MCQLEETCRYRYKYYFSKYINKQINFQRPLINNSNDCFLINNSIEAIFSNYAMSMVSIAMVQILLIIIILKKNFGFF